MPRTKDQLAKELAAGKSTEFYKDSTWDDLQNAMASQNNGQKTKVMSMLVNGNVGQVGQTLRDWLHADAEARAKAYVDVRLADGNLDMTELDEVL